MHNLSVFINTDLQLEMFMKRLYHQRISKVFEGLLMQDSSSKKKQKPGGKTQPTRSLASTLNTPVLSCGQVCSRSNHLCFTTTFTIDQVTKMIRIAASRTAACF